MIKINFENTCDVCGEKIRTCKYVETYKKIKVIFYELAYILKNYISRNLIKASVIYHTRNSGAEIKIRKVSLCKKCMQKFKHGYGLIYRDGNMYEFHKEWEANLHKKENNNEQS